MTGTEHWRRVAALDDVGVRDAILTGYRDGKPFAPYRPTIDLGAPRAVLDFGCGLGRNFPYLASLAPEVVGFDLPEMVERARGLPHPPGVALEADWDAVRARRFDLVFASLVFQHVEPAPLRDYLEGIFAVAPRCYVLSRGRHDFGGPTLGRLPASAAVGAGRLVEHDAASHELRVVGELGPEEVVALDDDRHVEVLVGARRA